MSGSSAMTTGNLISCYWSLPEQMKFRSLVAYFGRDFEAIANFMKNKSATMVCCTKFLKGYY